jgi:tetratricopeptide (TPR) repeat protein
LEGNRSKDKIEQLVLVASKLLLNQTKWFQSYYKKRNNYLSKRIAFDVQDPYKPYVDWTDGSINHKMFESHNHINLESRIEDTIPGLRHFEKTAKNEIDKTAVKSQITPCYRSGIERPEDALNFCIDILKTHPDDIDTLIAIGKLCLSLGRKDDAQVFFDRVLEIEPENQDTLCQLPKCRGSRTPVGE